MFKLDKNTGDITCFQGDSGELYFYNLPDDAVISFSAYDSNRNIKFEIFQDSNNKDTTTTRMFIPADETDKLTVAKNSDYQEYYYGIKLTKLENGERIEKTYLIGDSTIDDLNTIFVYPKRNEGDNDISNEQEE